MCSYASEYYVRDDRDESLYYSGTVSKSYLSTDTVNGSVSVLSPGASVSFYSWGSELYVYGVKYRNSGTFAVYIDNVLQGIYDSGQSVDYEYGILLYGNSGLTDSEHYVTLVCTSDHVDNPYTGQSVSGRLYVDFVESDKVYEDYYEDTLNLILVVICLFLFLVLVLKFIEFWRYMKIDN